MNLQLACFLPGHPASFPAHTIIYFVRSGGGHIKRAITPLPLNSNDIVEFWGTKNKKLLIFNNLSHTIQVQKTSFSLFIFDEMCDDSDTSIK